MDNIYQSPVLQAIEAAIVNQGNKQTGIRISITEEPLEHKNPKTGEINQYKALCWNLVNRKGEYVTDPVLATVHWSLTIATITADLHKFFPGRKAIVDNDIYIDNEE